MLWVPRPTGTSANPGKLAHESEIVLGVDSARELIYALIPGEHDAVEREPKHERDTSVALDESYPYHSKRQSQRTLGTGR